MGKATTCLIPTERIERSILLLRGQKVMLDSDLATLYGVETRILNQAVKRNEERFPEDFMFQLSVTVHGAGSFLRSMRRGQSPCERFQLSDEEFENWRSQIVTSNPAAKMGVRRKPYAFTEQGVAMLSSVLRSSQAVAVNIEIMRAFVRLRAMLASHADLARKLDAPERKYDAQFKVVFDAIRQLMTPPPAKKVELGFHTLRKPATSKKPTTEEPRGKKR